MTKPKVAVTVNNLPELGQAQKGGADIAEIKLDDYRGNGEYNIPFDQRELESWRYDNKPLGPQVRELILTMPRPLENGGTRSLDSDSKDILLKLAPYIDYTDIELYYGGILSEQYQRRRTEHMEIAKEFNVETIISYHDYHSTPDFITLQRRLDEAINAEADIAKICTTAHTDVDNGTMLRFVKENRKLNPEKRLMAWAMGEYGTPSRYLNNGEMVFASVGEPSAPGQLPLPEVRKLVDLDEETKESLIKPFMS